MFGYVKPVKAELLVREYEFYRATYCGICRAMKHNTGFLSNAALTYDSVFLALVRMLYLDDSAFSSKMRRCVAHPLKRKCMLEENEALAYVAKAFAVLGYHKVRDDLNDEHGMKKLAVTLSKPVLSGANKKANEPELSEIVEKKLDEISELERSGCPSADKPASLFGELLGEIFSHGLSDKDAIVCREFGTALGRFIYAADAAEGIIDPLALEIKGSLIMHVLGAAAAANAVMGAEGLAAFGRAFQHAQQPCFTEAGCIAGNFNFNMFAGERAGHKYCPAVRQSANALHFAACAGNQNFFHM